MAPDPKLPPLGSSTPLAAIIAALNCSLCCFHFGFLDPPPSGLSSLPLAATPLRTALGFRPYLPYPPADPEVESSTFSRPESLASWLENFGRLDWNTFWQIFMCFSRAFGLKVLLHVGHWHSELLGSEAPIAASISESLEKSRSYADRVAPPVPEACFWGDLLLGLCATDVECATWWWPLWWEHVPWPQFWWWWCVAKAAGSETVLFSTGLLIEPAEPLSLEATRELLEWTWCEEVAIDADGAYPFEEADLAVNRSRILSRLLPLDPSLALRLARLLASCPLPRLWLL